MAASTQATVYLRLPRTLRDRLVTAARDAGVPLNRFCETALAVYLEFLITEEGLHRHD